MLKRFLFLLAGIILCFNAYATHIVGGEFELEHLQEYNYRLTLNLYFDDVNGNPGALDQLITVNVFEKGSNRLMLTQDMTIKSQSYVNYTNIDCAIGSLRTRKIVYYETINLSPRRYNHSQGYYVTWERCCRNNTINNIVSPGAAAQTFYMEFPPVVKNGDFFNNSSPKLFPPLNDYACVGELFYFDFNGTDPDGDSLVYDMVTPLNGYTSTAMPAYNYYDTPGTAPYPEIRWLSGYSENTQIQGSPPINIDAQTGRLIMRPQSKGLFVFGIRCQEFRNGQKIGEVRRDFQVLVLECATNSSPEVMARAQGTTDLYKDTDVMRIDATGNRCVEVMFTDVDPNEFLSLKTLPENFSSSDYTFQGITQGNINQPGAANDTLKATICFAECFDTGGKVFKLNLIAQDDGCSLPRQDTLQLSFTIDPIPDTPPGVSLSTPTRVFEVTEGDVLSFDVTGFDNDGHDITLTATGQNFDLGSQNIIFPSQTKPGEVTSNFSWNINCATVQQESYLVEFKATSMVCGEEVSKTELVEVRTIYNNNAPVISTDQEILVIELGLDELFEASIFGNDTDMNGLTLSAAGEGFELSDLGMNFTSTGSNGEATGLFSWNAVCLAATNGVARVTFTLAEDACVPSPNQAITMEFHVKDVNDAPVISTDQKVLTFELDLNQPFEAKLFGEDINLNPLNLWLEGDGFDTEAMGMTFTSTNGNGKAEGVFNWVANCEAFQRGNIKVNFKLREDACSPFPDEVITMEFKVVVPELKDFVPANIFTPNGDGLNDYFEIPELPLEFCTASFSNITIFNRWGKEVFRSDDNKFKWDGKGVNDGVYFYVIDFRSSQYKGTVTIVH
ncbi:gliding motility-associated C-terminal domain-containing protein [Pontibacter silvestris]|uniref:Gliding motility-associated C-terminal domain-containing protein n=1 Tax=Pontibacter silvestris TaxID=2305183 RepID=A0ABW4X221_9BACT|nr:gliding motility-associated C-terminal domain-containing protein [Pontibacter silvestris]MCC9136001.1 gliding motility-associated C-terminal domain-containing protein [Pontibacter silvestris]